MRQSNDGMLGAMPVPRLVVTMSLPIMLSMLISAVYNLVDSVYVAQYSDEAFLALSYAYPIQMLLVAFCSGIGVGFSAIFSRRLGEGDQEQAASAVCHGFFLYGLCWLLFLLFALTGAAPFLRLSTEDPSVARQGAQYLLICCGLSIGTCMQFLTERILQAMGRPAGFMIVQGSGAILNLILDPIFIFVLDLGVAGAAAATVIGQISGALIGFWLVYRLRRQLPIRLRGFRPRGEMLAEMGRVAAPAVVMQSLSSFMSLGLNQLLTRWSESAVFVLGAYFKLQTFIFMPIFGISSGLIPILSYNYRGTPARVSLCPFWPAVHRRPLPVRGPAALPAGLPPAPLRLPGEPRGPGHGGPRSADHRPLLFLRRDQHYLLLRLSIPGPQPLVSSGGPAAPDPAPAPRRCPSAGPEAGPGLGRLSPLGADLLLCRRTPLPPHNSKTAPLNGALCDLNFPVNMSHINNGTDK